MSGRGPFRLAFLDGEPSAAARRAAAHGDLELIGGGMASDPALVDGVVVGGPLAQRAERVAEHLRAGVAVLAPPPLAADAAQHDAVVEAAEPAPGRLLVAYRQRWRPEVAELAAAVAAGELGRTGLVRMHAWGAGETDAVVRDTVDAVLWLAGATPQVVYAAGDPASGERAYLQAHLGFAGGGMALLDLARSPGEPYQALTVIGADGAAHADDQRNVQLLYDRHGVHGLPLHGDAELALLRAFVDGAASAAADERAVSAVTEAIAESRRSGSAVEVGTP